VFVGGPTLCRIVSQPDDVRRRETHAAFEVQADNAGRLNRAIGMHVTRKECYVCTGGKNENQQNTSISKVDRLASGHC
jgi:hypothetical protein